MKLLELTRSFYPSVGGLEKFVASRCKIYTDLQIDYKILTTDLNNGKLIDDQHNLKVVYLRQFTSYNITPDITKYLKDDYDLISINGIGRFFSDYAIWYVNKYKKAKIILTPHFTFHTNRFKLIKKLHSFFLVEKLLNRVDKIICFTTAEKKFWEKNYNIDEEKLVIIPHYFTIPAAGKQTGASEEKFILYLGRNDKNKRLDLLIKAYAGIKTDLKLYLTIAEKELSPSLRKYLGDKIQLLGTVSEEDKNHLLKNCECLIYPSDFEAFGISSFEASAYCKPLLASNNKIFKEILNSDGVIFFNNDLNSIQAAIENFLTLTPEVRKQMGRFNYENLKNYSFEHAKESYNKLFSELL